MILEMYNDRIDEKIKCLPLSLSLSPFHDLLKRKEERKKVQADKSVMKF